MIIDNQNPSLSDSCIPIAKIRSAMVVIDPHKHEFEPDKEIVIDHDVIVEPWHTLFESVKEIEIIIDHCENQEYAEVRARREAREALDKKIYAIRSRRINHAD